MENLDKKISFILSTHHVDFIDSIISDKKLFRIIKVDRITNPTITKKDKTKIKVKHPGRPNVLYSARFKDKYRGIVTTKSKKYLKNGVCLYITAKTDTVHVKILKQSLGISGAKNRQTVEEVVKYIINRIKNVDEMLKYISIADKNKTTLEWIKANVKGKELYLIKNTTTIVEKATKVYKLSSGGGVEKLEKGGGIPGKVNHPTKFVNSGALKSYELPLRPLWITGSFQIFEKDKKKYLILDGNFPFYEKYKLRIFFQVTLLPIPGRFVEFDDCDFSGFIIFPGGIKIIKKENTSSFIVDYGTYLKNKTNPRCYLNKVLFLMGANEHLAINSLIPRVVEYDSRHAQSEPSIMKLDVYDEPFAEIMKATSLRVPDEYKSGIYPDYINKKIADFLIDKVFDYAIYPIYCLILDFIYNFGGVVNGNLEYDTIKTIMIFTNFNIGFEIDLERLYMYEHIDFVIVQDDDNTKFVKIQLEYKIPENLVGEIKTNTKNPNIHTFHIYQNGRITQSGPHEVLNRHAYVKFVNYMKSIEDNIKSR